MNSTFVVLMALVSPLPALASKQNATPCPMHAQHQAAGETRDRMAGVNERGDEAMGFDHASTTHHFRLLSDGGTIEVDADDPADTESRDRIRQHLTHIATLFADGS